MVLQDSVALLVIGFIVAFLDSFGMGTNDVSHSFGTSIGSGTLSLFQACTLAIFTEFIGAVVLGNKNAKTIAGLASVDSFKQHPDALMLIMVCSLLGSSFWTIPCSKFGLPVSSTHSIAGAIIGCVLLMYGPSYVNWSIATGVGKILLSFVTSPIIAGLVAALIYRTCRFFILKHENSYKRAKIAVPFIFSLIVFIEMYLIMSNLLGTILHIGWQFGVAAISSAVSFVFFFFFMVPWMDRRVQGESLKWYQMFYIFKVAPRYRSEKEVKLLEEEQDIEKLGFFKKASNKISMKMKSAAAADITKYSKDTDSLHGKAEKFDPQTEKLFGFIQVLTAMFASLAHGANDVAIAIGPLSTIWYIFHSKTVTSSVPIPIGLIVFGCISMDIGLFTLGYRLMAVLGREITYLSPCRGVAAELAVALTVITAAASGIPVSIAQCICGATAGVALANGTFKALNLNLFGKIFSGWIVTMPITGSISALIFFIARNIVGI